MLVIFPGDDFIRATFKRFGKNNDDSFDDSDLSLQINGIGYPIWQRSFIFGHCSQASQSKFYN